MTTWYPYTICYRWSIVTESVSPAVCEILSPNILGSQHTLRHWSRDDSIPHAVSYWCSIETGPLSPSVRKLFDSKYICYSTQISYSTQIYRDLSRSRDVIGHMTIRFSICSFLLVLHWNQVPISKRFRDIWLQISRGHDLDLSRSRDVIGHVTIWCPI